MLKKQFINKSYTNFVKQLTKINGKSFPLLKFNPINVNFKFRINKNTCKNISPLRGVNDLTQL